MPTTTTGNATNFITFSRGTLATVTDADGKIKWAPHNLLLRSEQLDSTTSWSRFGFTIAAPTVTANAAAAPNGTTTAEEVAFPAVSGSSDTSLLIQSLNSVAAAHTGGIWMKAKAAGDVGKQIVTYVYDTAYVAKVHTTLTADWQLVSLSGTATSAALQFSVGVVGTGAGGVNQGAVSVFLWGAHLYRADLGGMQSNASAYPLYNPSTPKNLLGYSEAFDNAAWTKSSVSVTANAIAAPNGSLTADLLKEDVGSAWHSAYQGATTAASGTYTLSVYLKSGGRQYANLSIGSGTATSAWASITADLTGGTITSNQAGATGTYVSSAITSVGDGWYRVSMVGKIGSNTDATFSVALSDVASPSRGNYAVYSYNGNGTSGIYLWGAQLSDSASLDAYVPNFGAAPSAAAAHGPRLDYRNGSALGLLVEEARTNLLPHSQYNSSYWLTAAGSITVTTNYSVSPDGNTNATRLLEGSTGSIMRISSATITSGATYAFSIWIKSNTASNYTVGVDVGDGTGQSATVTPQWQRISIVAVNGGAGNFVDLFLPTGADVSVYQAQLELGAFSTSIIPNAGTLAGVTRNADVASVGVSQFPYSASEGTIVAAYSPLSTSGAQRGVFAFTDGTNNNYADWRPNSSQMQVVSAGVFSADLYPGGGTIGAVAKGALTIKANDFAACVNGGTVQTDTSGAVPVGIDRLLIGYLANSSIYAICGHIRQITYIPRRLTNAELQSRTA